MWVYKCIVVTRPPLQKKRCFQLNIALQQRIVPVRCIGQGGLTLGRIQSKCIKYFRELQNANPSVLILDLGTNDLCSTSMDSDQVHSLLCDFVHEFSKRGINPEVIVFLPVLPRTGSMRDGQVSLEEFNSRVKRFNELVQQSTFREDRWWVWEHRGLRNSRYIIDGVHLNEAGMLQYERTLRQLVKFFESRIWP